MTTSKEDKKQKEYQAVLEQLLKEQPNKKCADCGAAAPRWASASLGVFICMRCAGIHRNIGVHVTFVRSVTLDKWSEEQIQKVLAVGNQRAMELYEAKVPAGYPRPNPSDNASIEKWIRDKYERKKFIGDPGSLKPQATPKPVLANSNGNSNGNSRGNTNGKSHGARVEGGNELFGEYTSAAKPATIPLVAPVQQPARAIPNPFQAPPAQQPVNHVAPPQATLVAPPTGQQQQAPAAHVALQGIKIMSPEEQAAAKRANVLQVFDQQQQQQMYGQQYAQAYANAYAQPHMMQMHYPAQPLYYDPRLQYAYPAGAYAMSTTPAVGMQQHVPANDPILQQINTMNQEKRQTEFGTLFG